MVKHIYFLSLWDFIGWITLRKMFSYSIKALFLNACLYIAIGVLQCNLYFYTKNLMFQCNFLSEKCFVIIKFLKHSWHLISVTLYETLCRIIMSGPRWHFCTCLRCSFGKIHLYQIIDH